VPFNEAASKQVTSQGQVEAKVTEILRRRSGYTCVLLRHVACKIFRFDSIHKCIQSTSI